MPDALTFIIGADAQPFAREMRQMENIAARSASSITSRIAEGSHGTYSGIIRESITIVREAIEGRGIGRIIGSGSLLAQYLHNLATGSKSAAKEAEEAAAKFNLMALRQSQAATASLEQAAALEKSWTANKDATDADLEAAIAARAQAVEEEKAAIALDQKAAAAARTATIEEAESAVAKQAAASTNGWVAKMLSILPALSGLTIAIVIANNLRRGFEMIAEAAELSANKIGGITNRLEAIRSVTQQLADQAQEFKKWREKLNEADDSVSEPLRERLKAMREEFELRQKLADLKGQTPQQKAKAELDEQKAELQEMKDAQSDASWATDQAIKNTDKAEKHFQTMGPQKQQAEVSEKDADVKARILAAVMGAQGEQETPNTLLNAWRSNTLPQLFSAFTTGMGDQLINVEVDGKKISTSVNEARKGFEASQKNADINRQVVRDAEIKVADAKEKEQKARSESKKIDTQVTEAQSSYDLHKQLDPQIAAAEALKHHGESYHQQLNALQKVGGMYSVPGSSDSHQIAKRTEEHTRRTAVAVEKLASKSRPMGAAHFGP